MCELNQRLLTEGSYRVTTLASYQHNMWMTARGLGLLLVFAVGIAETGTHDELMTASGPYQRLHAAQASPERT